MLKAEADIEARDDDGETPLHYAARAASAEVVSALFKAGADIDAQNDDGDTPPVIAAIYGNIEAASIFLNAYASRYRESQ